MPEYCHVTSPTKPEEKIVEKVAASDDASWFRISDEAKKAWLKWVGVTLSKDGKAIMNYNPGPFQAGANFLVGIYLIPSFQTRSLWMQCLFLMVIMHIYCWFLSDTWEIPEGCFEADDDSAQCTAFDGSKMGLLDGVVEWCYANISSLSRFVLGLYVSLLLAKTYYSNRGVFGTVFGCSMGLAQMTTAWVRPPQGYKENNAAQKSAKDAQDLIVRYINSAFRLMWLEVIPGMTKEKIQEEIVKEGAGLLTFREWSKISDLSSRCTHIYQWISNLLCDLMEEGYIATGQQLTLMQVQVDKCRAANVWGLPSLPITYTALITIMVKMHVFVLSLNNGRYLAQMSYQASRQGLDFSIVFGILIIHGDMMTQNFLYQGLLDLHGALYSPNSGIKLGHLPALNFMDFVKNVTEHLVSENDDMPYVDQFSVARIKELSNL